MTDKAARILKKMKERDRQGLMHWKPYNGLADWSFIGLDVPKKVTEERMHERPGVSNGCAYSGSDE